MATQGLFFLSLLYQTKTMKREELQDLIHQHFFEGEWYSISEHTMADYYSKEMGEASSLKRLLCFSPELSPREGLITLKLKAHEWEQKTLDGEHRRVNIDPGLLCLEQVLLSSMKPYAHRTYHGLGVYTELVYLYQAKKFGILPWTYPDYAQASMREIFQREREKLLVLRP